MRPSSDNLEKTQFVGPQRGLQQTCVCREELSPHSCRVSVRGSCMHASGCSGAVMVLTSDNQALPSYGL